MLGKIAALMGLALLAGMAASPAQALSSHDCSTKYKAAQDQGLVGDMKYADFRKAYCGSDATIDSPMPTAASTSSSSTGKSGSTPSGSATTSTTSSSSSSDIGTSAEPNVTNTEHSAEPAAPTTVAPSGVPFPSKVDPKYASDSPGKARMYTCLDQYRINKANNKLGGLTWIMKGGGYYSICNAKLKAS